MDQWQLEELAKVCRKAKVKIVTDGLSPEVLAGLLRRVGPQRRAGRRQLRWPNTAPTREVAVIPKGPYVLSCLGG